MKILVTGGAGFIGSHIVDTLLQHNCEVVIIDDLSTGSVNNINSAAKFIKMDIRSEELLDVFVQEKFDFVIHEAAQTMVHKSLEVPKFDCDVNIMGTVNVLEACRKTNVKRIIFASTAATYGDVSSLPVKESTATDPTSFYGLSKLTCEQYLALYYKIYGLEYVVLRYANVYGERQGDAGEGGVISIFTRKVYQNSTVTIYGDGEQTRDFIYVGDVANANYHAVITKNSNAVYNISTQTETSVNELLEHLENIAGIKIEKNYTEVREGDIFRSTLSNENAKAKLSWQPQTILSNGLKKTYQSLSKNFNNC